MIHYHLITLSCLKGHEYLNHFLLFDINKKTKINMIEDIENDNSFQTISKPVSRRPLTKGLKVERSFKSSV